MGIVSLFFNVINLKGYSRVEDDVKEEKLFSIILIIVISTSLHSSHCLWKRKQSTYSE